MSFKLKLCKVCVIESALNHLQNLPEWMQSQGNYGSFLSKSDLHGTILYKRFPKIAQRVKDSG